jgi:hypothetical protein
MLVFFVTGLAAIAVAPIFLITRGYLCRDQLLLWEV